MSSVILTYGDQVARVIPDSDATQAVVADPVKSIRVLLAQGPAGPAGAGSGSGAIRTSENANDVFVANDYTLLMDSTSGNKNVSLSPGLLPSKTGNIKKISSDTNSVFLNVTSGKIFTEFGLQVTQYDLYAAGKTVYFQSDGVNIYILSGLG